MNYQTRVIAMLVVPEGDPIFSKMATTIEIDDEAAGEFVKISQEEGGYVAFGHEEWPVIRAAIDKMFKEVRK